MLTSKVKGYEGPCKPTWVNRNQVCNRFDGGVSGFFRLVRKRLGIHLKTGDQFHGIVRDGKIVESTGEVDHNFDDHYRRSQHADKTK